MKLHHIFLCLVLSSPALAQQPAFQVVPLGVKGGVDESNLSCYALAAFGTNEYICLDAGTIHAGIQKAIDAEIWKGDATEFQKRNIKAYLITHPHIDHLSGMVINAPEDSPKQIYATEFTITAMKEKYFSWKIAANFTNEGEMPRLNKYTLVHLAPGVESPIQNTSLAVTSFVLSHSNPFESTAFLINQSGKFLLYLGDTGADEIEKSDRLHGLWKTIAPLIKSGSLKAIFIEVSFANEQPLDRLFGHLTPQLFTKEMKALADLSGINHLQQVPIVITHMKPLGKREAIIRQELNDLNVTGMKLVFPEQAHALEF